MRAALLNDYGQPLELVEQPMPEPTRPTDVVVRVGGAGVCATDLHAIDGMMGAAGMAVPRVLGHENAGWVEAAGDLVSTVAPENAVIVHPAYTCGLCIACRRGLDMYCEHHQFTGLSLDGGFAEYVVVSERQLIRLPSGVEPAAVAAHADAGMSAYNAVKKVLPLALPGTTAVVIGIGGVGHIGLQLFRELGGSVLVAVETHAERQRLAAELGAKEILDGGDGTVDAVRELTGGRGADIVVDFVGSDGTHADGIAMLARGGAYSIVGYGGQISVPSIAMVGGERSMIGNLAGSWLDLWDVMQLQIQGRITLKAERHSLDDINDVLAKLRGGEVNGRAVLVPS